MALFQQTNKKLSDFLQSPAVVTREIDESYLWAG